MSGNFSNKTVGFSGSTHGAALKAKADFRHVETWVFDLDNTLYDASAGFLTGVEDRIGRFLQTRLELSPQDAHALQKKYFHEHGTTLVGLMRFHEIDVEDYLAFVNDVDVAALEPNPQLAAAISALPGEHYVFTNNCGRYAERVLERLGLTHLFRDIWDVRALGFAAKPDPSAYETIARLGGFTPKRAAMFDDIPHNLAPSHALGMTTVWLKGASTIARPDYIHYETGDLCAFLADIEVERKT